MTSLITDQSWREALANEFHQLYFKQLLEKVKVSYKNETIYPSKKHIFEALNLTPLDAVKVVIIGQDPYHGEGQAHGLAFSVRDKVATPPSLQNIYKESKVT